MAGFEKCDFYKEICPKDGCKLLKSLITEIILNNEGGLQSMDEVIKIAEARMRDPNVSCALAQSLDNPNVVLEFLNSSENPEELLSDLKATTDELIDPEA